MSETTTPEPSPSRSPKKESALKTLLNEFSRTIADVKARVQVFFRGGAANIAKLPILIIFSPFYALRGIMSMRTSTQIILTGLIVGVYLMTYSSSRYFRKASIPKPVSQAELAKEEHEQEVLKAHKELQEKAERIVVMSRFVIHLEAEDGNLKEYSIGMYFETDKPETKTFLKTQLVAVREIVSLIAQTKSYKQMMSEEGKEDFKSKVINAINAYLKRRGQNGKVLNAEFSDMLLDA